MTTRDYPVQCRPLEPISQAGRIVVDSNHTMSFVELRHAVALNFALNHLQVMALQLVCKFLDRHAADPDSAGQHFQYIGGPRRNKQISSR